MNSFLLNRLMKSFFQNPFNRLSQKTSINTTRNAFNKTLSTNATQSQRGVCNRFRPTIGSRVDPLMVGGVPALVSVAGGQQVRLMAHKMPLTYDFIRERILLLLKLYDKIDPQKLTLDSHFYNDLGLDSLDHVEVIMAIEDEFHFEIPDSDAERLLTPRDLLKYISDKEEAYEGLQTDDHHDHH